MFLKSMKDYDYDHKTYEQESKDKLQVSFKENDPEQGFRLTVSILSERYGDSKRALSLDVSGEDVLEAFDPQQWQKFVTLGNRANGFSKES